MSTRKKKRVKRSTHTLATLARALTRVDCRLEDIGSSVTLLEANALSLPQVSDLQSQLRANALIREQLRAVCKLAAAFASADPLIDAERFSDAGRVMRAALIGAGFLPPDAVTPSWLEGTLASAFASFVCKRCGGPHATSEHDTLYPHHAHETDPSLCGQCGHPRSDHSAEGCNRVSCICGVFELATDPSGYTKCPDCGNTVLEGHAADCAAVARSQAKP